MIRVYTFGNAGAPDAFIHENKKRVAQVTTRLKQIDVVDTYVLVLHGYSVINKDMIYIAVKSDNVNQFNAMVKMVGHDEQYGVSTLQFVMRDEFRSV